MSASKDESATTTAVYPPLDQDSLQLTARAILTGMLLGGLLSLCNIYLGLRIGWGTNMSITGVLLGFALWRGIQTAFPRTRPFGILESNINQTACSAAAAVSSAGLVAPIPALTMMTGQQLPWILLAIWVFSVCIVGILAAASIRRQMIDVDRLPFPGGIACAQTLKEVYGKGQEAMQRVAMLGVGAVAAGAFKLLDLLKVVKAWALPGSVGGHKLSSFDFVLEPSLLMVGVGALIGMRAALSMILGAILAWGVLAPWAINTGRAELKARESLAALPEGVVIPLGDPLQWRDGAKRLEFRGVMTEEKRQSLRSMSPDPAWTSAIDKLFLESRIDTNPADTSLSWSTLVPLPTTAGAPIGVSIPAELSGEIRVVGGSLLGYGAITAGMADTLIAANGGPDAGSELVKTIRSLQTESALVPVRANFTDVLEWMLWPGVTLMVVSSLVSFSFSWRSILRTFTGGGGSADGVEANRGDVPGRWILGGAAVAVVGSMLAQMFLFDIAWWAAITGVVLSVVLAIVASRVSGETNITPIGAMGKVTQLVFGAAIPASPAANLMTANVTGGAASQCADMMHDLKTGAMLGATPWKQIVAQTCGALSGALIGSAFYLILIPDPARMLMTPDWPAPAVATWKAVAEIFQLGPEALPKGSVEAMLVAAIVGVLLPILEKTLPKQYRAWLPSASSLGLSFVVAAKFAISIFIGAVLALIVGRLFKSWTARFLVTLASGFVVGDALVGAGDAIYRVLSDLAQLP
jgi:uncharacterized oligopeptide transporter (OPT) family protein